MRKQLVARALDDRGLGLDGDLVALGDGLELGRRVHDARRPGRWAARGHAARVRAREQQQVGHQPAHALGRAQGRLGRLALVALEHDRQQLQVGEHAGQRRAQLVRDVGDELALALEHLLGLGARLVQRAQHALQRARQLGDLVLGLGPRHLERGVARALDLARHAGQLGDRAHGPPGHKQAGQQGQGAPPSTPSASSRRTRETVWLTEGSGRAYWMIALSPASSADGRDSTR